jgi:deoxyribonuclease-1-like protein
MRRIQFLIVLGGLIYGGIWFFQRYQIDGINSLTVKPRTPATATSYTSSSPGVAPSASATIRIASFNIQVFGVSKLAKPEVMDILAQTVRKFDLMAIQEVRSVTDDVLPRFLQLINSTGRHYDFRIGPRLGRTNSKEQYAFIYDTQTIEVDPNSIYTVSDPENLFQRPPFVASFRARGPPPDQAFTFTLIDIHTEPDEAAAELNALAPVYRAVRNESAARSGGIAEDDIILLGDLNADERKFGALKQLPNMSWIISGVPTNTRGNKTYDNMLFNRAATTEFTGRFGVLDIMREYNLTLDKALEVSDHFPIWAEFSVYEGGQPGHTAARPDVVPQR